MAWNYEYERFRFVTMCVEAGMPEVDAQAIARDANTCDLWAVRECNGEVEHREEACEERGRPLGTGWGHAQTHKRLVVPAGTWLYHHNVEGPGPSYYTICRRPTGPWAEARIRARVAKMGKGWEARFNGDPRGTVVCIKIPGQLGNCGDGDWIAVPARSH